MANTNNNGTKMRINSVINIAKNNIVNFRGASDSFDKSEFQIPKQPKSDTFEKTAGKPSDSEILDETERLTRVLMASILSENINPDYHANMIERFAEPALKMQRELMKTALQSEKMEDTVLLLLDWASKPENKALSKKDLENTLKKVTLLQGTGSEDETDDSSFAKQSLLEFGEIAMRSGIDNSFLYILIAQSPDMAKAMTDIIKRNLIEKSIITDFMQYSQKSGQPLPENIYMSIYNSFKEL